MVRALNLCRIIYKILGLDEKDVPIILSPESKRCAFKKRKTDGQKCLILGQILDFKIYNILDISQCCYLAYEDKNGLLDDFYKHKDNPGLMFYEKSFRDPIHFGFAIVSKVLDIMLTINKTDDLIAAKESFSKPYNDMGLDLSDEDRANIRVLLKESYFEIKENYEERINQFHKEIEDWVTH